MFFSFLNKPNRSTFGLAVCLIDKVVCRIIIVVYPNVKMVVSYTKEITMLIVYGDVFANDFARRIIKRAGINRDARCLFELFFRSRATSPIYVVKQL